MLAIVLPPVRPVSEGGRSLLGHGITGAAAVDLVAAMLVEDRALAALLAQPHDGLLSLALLAVSSALSCPWVTPPTRSTPSTASGCCPSCASSWRTEP